MMSDRELGEYWENKFCVMAAHSDFGRSFVKHQFRRSGATVAEYKLGGRHHTVTMPYVTILTTPGEHHEVKHKDPTQYGKFGLEVYRFNALVWILRETGQNVYYTIHNYALQPEKIREERKHNPLCYKTHWVTASIEELIDNISIRGNHCPSLIGGKITANVPQYFWDKGIFRPLISLWSVVPCRDEKGHLIP